MKKTIFSLLLLTFLYSLSFSATQCGVTGVDWYSSTLSAPFSIRHELGCLVFNNKMWVIGGAGPAWPVESDVWSSTDGATWTLANATAAFGQRGAAGYLVYDNGTGEKMWVIGGQKNGTWLKDVWYSSNGADWFIATGNAAFGIRECMAAYVYDNKMWIAGGYNNTNKNDVWWSSNGADWFQATSNAAWSPRSYPAFEVFDNGTGPKMWIIGGGLWGTTTGYSDVWYSSDGANWTRATLTGFAPRLQARAEVYDGKIWVMGGENAGKQNDVWYTSDGVSWTMATGSAAFSDRSDGATMVYDNRMWYIGGLQTASLHFNDVWYTGCAPTPAATNTLIPTATLIPTPMPTNTPVCGTIGVNWNAAALNAAFPGRYYHESVAYDDGTGEKMWVIGGANAVYPHFKDVWYSSNGVDWSLATGNAAFGERSAACTFKHNGKVWVVAGDSSSVTKNDVWYTTDMRNWIAATTSAGFSARTLAAGILYDDGAGEKMWVIAGAVSTTNTIYLKDVWCSSDGASWVQKTASASFPNRMGAAGVSYGGKMWISGGLSPAYAAFNDVWWSTDGVTWNLATANAAFGPRHLHTMEVYDGKMWIIGGVTYAQSTVYNDAWWSTDGVTWNLANTNTGMGNARAAGSCIFNSKLYLTGGNAGKGVWYTCGSSIPVSTATPVNTVTPVPAITPVCGTIGVDWNPATLSAPFAVRHEHGLLVYNSRMWVIGGGGPVWPNEKDIWSSADGANWTLENASAAFGPRGAGGYLVYDNGTGLKMWLIGGEHDGVWQRDVWNSSNGVDWAMVTGNAAYGTRECQASYVYDNKMWIAGGYNGANKNDVWWSSNGADWYQATSGAPWSPRSYPAFAVYDNGTGPKMWIIGGGLWGGTTGYSDVWSSSDGVTWTQSAGNFQPRMQARAEVFDGKLWIIGGINGAGLNDVWFTTDGSTWTQATGAAAFVPRSDGATCVFDNRMWYVAGMRMGVTNLKDVWYTCGNSLATPVPTDTPIVIPPTETPADTAAVNTPAETDTPLPVATSTPTPRPEPAVRDGDSRCYPTRAKDHLKIVFNTGKKADVKIYVYDISGKLVKTIDMKTGTTPNEKLYKVNLDVRGFEPGVYYYVIQGKAERGELVNFKSKKFIVKGSK